MVLRRTILVLEDEPAVATELETLLEDQGFAVVAAKTAATARFFIERSSLHFAFIDYGSGQSLAYLTQFLAQSQTPFAICSSDARARDAASKSGVPFVGKPVSATDLLSVLRIARRPPHFPPRRDAPWGMAL